LSQTVKEQRNERTNEQGYRYNTLLYNWNEIKILISHLFILFYIYSVFFFSFLVNGPIKFYTMVQHEI
jgi:steroid 5-alpha reductase family enzyme